MDAQSRLQTRLQEKLQKVTATLALLTPIGWSDFASQRHVPGTGFSYFSASPDDVIVRTGLAWEHRKPGFGEQDLSRKVVVPLHDPNGFYCPPTVPLKLGLPIRCEVTQRQPGEDPSIELFVDIVDAVSQEVFRPLPAKAVEIVCYSAEACLENGGTRTTTFPWEIVAVLCHSEVEEETMDPLTMARNYLQKPGGTFTDYTAKEFAEAIYNRSTRRRLKVKGISKFLPGVYFIDKG